MVAYLLWHIHHGVKPVADAVVHRDDDGGVVYDDEVDDCKLIGAFSSTETVTAAKTQLSTMPGFRDEPDCFVVDECLVDRVSWTSGFVTANDDD